MPKSLLHKHFYGIAIDNYNIDTAVERHFGAGSAYAAEHCATIGGSNLSGKTFSAFDDYSAFDSRHFNTCAGSVSTGSDKLDGIGRLGFLATVNNGHNVGILAYRSFGIGIFGCAHGSVG